MAHLFINRVYLFNINPSLPLLSLRTKKEKTKSDPDAIYNEDDYDEDEQK